VRSAPAVVVAFTLRRPTAPASEAEELVERDVAADLDLSRRDPRDGPS
jgi:hypothetical protein